jgi:crossover junction endodeoxyribonuclease RusA
VTDRVVSFFAPGLPASQGSKRPFVNKKTGKVILVESDKTVKSWRGVVALAARDAGATALEGPVFLALTFRFPRPKGHYRTGKRAAELRPDAPLYPATKTTKDWDKLARACGDALTGVCYVDDAQVAFGVVKKRWCRPGQPAGVMVTVAPCPGGLALREDDAQEVRRAPAVCPPGCDWPSCLCAPNMGSEEVVCDLGKHGLP